MEQGPQNLRDTARFVAGIYRTRWFTLRARLARERMALFDTPAGRRDPYPIHESIRARGRLVDIDAGFLVTADHRLCHELVRSRAFGVRDPETGIVHGRLYEATDVVDRGMLGTNPPDHTRLRRIAQPGFNPRLMRSYEDTVEKRIGTLLDGLATRESFDLVHKVAAPLPIAVITDLLGLPDADTAAFERYGQAMASSLDGIKSVTHALRLAVGAARLEAIFQRLFRLREQEPREDLVTALVTARDAGVITPREAVAMCQLLLVAGFETTVNLIGNTIVALHGTPGAWDQLVADPSLAGLAVEEALRFDPPVQRTIRVALEDTQFGDRPIPRGTWVVVLIGGANRDPQVYDRPGEFVLDRYADRSTPDHLAFSGGVHYCIGAPLARMEATIAVRRLAETLPGLRLVGEPRMRKSVSVRGPASLIAVPA